MLTDPLAAIPESLAHYKLERGKDGLELVYSYDTQAERGGIPTLLADLAAQGIGFKDLHTEESSLEDIFVDLVSERP